MRASGYRASFGALALLIATFQGAAAQEATATAVEWARAGAAALREDRPVQAILIFGQLLAEQPESEVAAEGLDRALAALGETGRAEAYLRHLLGRETRPLRRTAFLTALHRLDRTVPLRFGLGFAVLPSSNIKRNSSQSRFDTSLGTFVIDEGGEEDSGLGYRVSGRTAWHLPGSGPGFFRIDARIAAAWYEERSMQYVEPRLGFSYAHLGTPIEWRLGVHTGRRIYPEVEDVTPGTRGFRGVSATARLIRPEARFWSFGALFEQRDFDEKDYLDGSFAALKFAHGWPAGPGSGRARLGFTLSRSLTERDYHAYSGAKVDVSYKRNLGEGLRVGLLGQVEWRNYHDTFPTLDHSRLDRSYGIGVSAELRRLELFGTTPELTCLSRRNDSNVALYTFDTIDCSLAFDYRF